MADSNAPTAPRRSWARRARRLAVALLICYVLYGLALMGFQERLIFPRDVPGPRDPRGPIPAGVEPLTITADDGSVVPAWLRLPARADGVRVPAVIFFHGNAELMDDVAMYEEVRMFPEMGAAVLVVEYRGYGRAGGEPSQAALTADALKFHDLLVQRPEIDPKRIVYYGRSLGGGVACALAAERPPRVMILQSTFISVTSMAARMLVPPFLVRHPFRNDQVVATLDAPILFLHGRRDSIIPCWHSEKLVRLCRRGLLCYQDCDHNDFPSDHRALRKDVEGFLRGAGVLE